MSLVPIMFWIFSNSYRWNWWKSKLNSVCWNSAPFLLLSNGINLPVSRIKWTNKVEYFLVESLDQDCLKVDAIFTRDFSAKCGVLSLHLSQLFWIWSIGQLCKSWSFSIYFQSSTKCSVKNSILVWLKYPVTTKECEWKLKY